MGCFVLADIDPAISEDASDFLIGFGYLGQVASADRVDHDIEGRVPQVGQFVHRSLKRADIEFSLSGDLCDPVPA